MRANVRDIFTILQSTEQAGIIKNKFDEHSVLMFIPDIEKVKSLMVLDTVNTRLENYILPDRR